MTLDKPRTNAIGTPKINKIAKEMTIAIIYPPFPFLMPAPLN